MGGVTDEDEAAVHPAGALYIHDLILDQLIEGLEPGEDTGRWRVRATPGDTERVEIARLECGPALVGSARGKGIGASVDRERTEEAGRCPCFHAGGNLTRHEHADVTNAATVGRPEVAAVANA
jgi:hypothetical protein